MVEEYGMNSKIGMMLKVAKFVLKVSFLNCTDAPFFVD
jgi:hypothetical protein